MSLNHVNHANSLNAVENRVEELFVSESDNVETAAHNNFYQSANNVEDPRALVQSDLLIPFESLLRSSSEASSHIELPTVSQLIQNVENPGPRRSLRLAEKRRRSMLTQVSPPPLPLPVRTQQKHARSRRTKTRRTIYTQTSPLEPLDVQLRSTLLADPVDEALIEMPRHGLRALGGKSNSTANIHQNSSHQERSDMIGEPNEEHHMHEPIYDAHLVEFVVPEQNINMIRGSRRTVRIVTPKSPRRSLRLMEKRNKQANQVFHVDPTNITFRRGHPEHPKRKRVANMSQLMNED